LKGVFLFDFGVINEGIRVKGHFDIRLFDIDHPVPAPLLEQYGQVLVRSFGSHAPALNAIRDRLSSSFPQYRAYLALGVRTAGGFEAVKAGAWYVFSRPSKSVYVSGFCVDASVQGRGIGSAFFRDSEALLRQSEPSARFLVAETRSVAPPFFSRRGEEKQVTLARARFWERAGFHRVELGGVNRAEDGSAWDVRIRAIGGEPLFSLSGRTLTKVLIDFHRNPLVHDYSKTLPHGFKLTREGKQVVRSALGAFNRPVVGFRPRIPKPKRLKK